MNGIQTNMNKELIGKAKRALGGVKNSKKFDFKTKTGVNDYLDSIGLGTDRKKKEPGKLYAACEKTLGRDGLSSKERKDLGINGRVFLETYIKGGSAIRLVYGDSYEDLMTGISILVHIFKDNTLLTDMIENNKKAREIIRGAGQSESSLRGDK